MYTYSVEHLKAKTFSELKSIARDISLVPLGDRRCRQNWVDALVGVQLPLLKLLEIEPVAEAKRKLEVQAPEPIEVQVQEPIETQAHEAIVYPKLAVILIAQNEIRPDIDRTESADRLEVQELIKQAGVYEIVPEPPDPYCFSRATPFMDAFHAYYRRYPYCHYCDARHKLNTKIFLGIEADRFLPPIEEAAKISPAALEADRSLPPIEYAAQTSPGVSEGDRSLELIDGSFRSTSPKKIALATVEGIRLIYADWADSRRFFQLLKQKVDEVLQTLPISSLKLLEAEIISLLPSNLSIAEIQDRERFGDLRKRAFWVRQVYSVCQFHCHVAWLKVLPESPYPEWETASFEDFSKFSNSIKEQKSFENSSGVESAIGLATKNSAAVETDQNSILTGITFFPGFLACYSPSQTDNIHYQSDADGQLSLLDFEVESVDEPLDPDDFESLNAFREAIALWDATHPELIEIGLDSFSEWALCPDDWYEPDTLLEPSEVLELSPAILSEGCANESFSTCKFLIPVFDTCKFLIPVFDAWCDRTNGNSDEPPTAGVGALLPKLKPPSFLSMGIVAGDRSSIKKFARSVTLLSGRAPPGGDAVQS